MSVKGSKRRKKAFINLMLDLTPIALLAGFMVYTKQPGNYWKYMLYGYFALFIVAIIIGIIKKKTYGNSEWKGRYGEKLTEDELNRLKRFGIEGRVFRNIYLPKEDGGTSEVDVVFVTSKGIFIIESKNYSGWIYGDENNKNWTATLENGQKNHFYNPIWQNKSHVKWMSNLVGEDVPLYSIIAFSERCEFKDVSALSRDVAVIKRDQIIPTIRSVWDSNSDKIFGGRIELICEKLQQLTNVDEETKNAHIDAVNEYKVQSSRGGNFTHVCPRCGKELILRTVNKGQNKGKQFYGCSGFPKCRYTMDL